MTGQPPLEVPIADSLSPTELMEQKLLTKHRCRWYKIGGQTVARVFGQIKAAGGFDKFMQLRFKTCCHQWWLICARRNLLKL